MGVTEYFFLDADEENVVEDPTTEKEFEEKKAEEGDNFVLQTINFKIELELY